MTPGWSVFKENIPAGHPRTQCYLDEYLTEENIAKAKNHAEYSRITIDGESALDYKSPEGNPYESLSSGTVKALVNAYILDPGNAVSYKNKMLETLRALLAYNVTDSELTAGGNFSGSDRASALSTLYDYCYDELTETERATAEDVIQRVTSYYFNQYKGGFECMLWDNHVWQVVLQRITQAVFAICDKSEVAMENLEYAYEVWTARAPNSGFNRDGAWINGGGYFGVNIYTLFYMPMLFSEVTDSDFLQHPWYRNAGKALVYAWLPGTCETSFGDQCGEYGYSENGKAQMEFADFIAREVQDPHAAWYVNEMRPTLQHHNATNLRLYRILADGVAYTGQQPDLENYVWHQDIGSGIAFSDMEHPESNLGLAFRSSPFGSGSHTLADQNSFKILYKGDYVYRNAGYYTSFADGHTLLQYRHTRGHNTIMINNIGQAFTTQSYGEISQGLNGDNLAYFLGDASNAYYPFSDYWDDRMGNYAQTPEYGFGENPLNKYKRHIFMLRPDKVLIYDDLGADEPATWQWMLHSDNEFQIEGDRIVSHFSPKSGRGDFVSVAEIFSDYPHAVTKTNEWFMHIEPVEDGKTYSKQWHLTADFEATATNRILTVIQLNDSESAIEDVWRVGNEFKVGNWRITAEMDGDKPACISVVNETTGTYFNYGGETPVVNGEHYVRQQEGSSVLYDKVKGNPQMQEVGDRPLYVTKSAM